MLQRPDAVIARWQANGCRGGRLSHGLSRRVVDLSTTIDRFRCHRYDLVTAKELRRILRSFGCVESRQRGSHLRIECGRCVTTVPVHAGEDIRARPAAPYRARLEAVPRKGMGEESVKSYRVAYERDESGWWVATVRGVRGCHTQGRTVDEAQRRIREALGLFVERCPQGHHRGRSEAADCRDKGDSGLRDSSQEGR